MFTLRTKEMRIFIWEEWMDGEGEGCRAQNYLYETKIYYPAVLFIQSNFGHIKMLSRSALVMKIPLISGFICFHNNSSRRHSTWVSVCCLIRTQVNPWSDVSLSRIASMENWGWPRLVPGPHLLPYLCSAHHLNIVSSSILIWREFPSWCHIRDHKKEDAIPLFQKRQNQPLSMEAFNTTWYPCLETELWSQIDLYLKNSSLSSLVTSLGKWVLSMV